MLIREVCFQSELMFISINRSSSLFMPSVSNVQGRPFMTFYMYTATQSLGSGRFFMFLKKFLLLIKIILWIIIIIIIIIAILNNINAQLYFPHHYSSLQHHMILQKSF